MKILLTGFDPFGGETVNPAFEAVKLLPDTIAGAEIVKQEVPTEFIRAGEVLEAGIPSALSYTAGSYVCNYLMYTLLYLIDRKYPNIRGGFIHVPYAMEQVVNKPLGTPSMDLHQIARGLEKAVEAVVKNDADLAVDMGTTH